MVLNKCANENTWCGYDLVEDALSLLKSRKNFYKMKIKDLVGFNPEAEIVIVTIDGNLENVNIRF